KSDTPTEKRTFPLASSFASPSNPFSFANDFNGINGFSDFGLLPFTGLLNGLTPIVIGI
ncbi:763_t:CDS:1, partial [Racocetra fulgida]